MPLQLNSYPIYMSQDTTSQTSPLPASEEIRISSVSEFIEKIDMTAEASTHIQKNHLTHLLRTYYTNYTKAHFQNSRKEVFQPHLPVRLPCYDLAPVTCITLGRPSRLRTLGTPDSHGLTGGVYKARERIHRAMADARLLANPASRSRVADSDPNCDKV